MRPFVLHAHFYQPERLNPWTGALDPEPSAAPDRDWNARILRECYHPNAEARIYDADGRVERIVNNYERVSFDFGPTLLSWMERSAPRTYARVLDGDWRSVVRTGHGNALAQAYNHTILPLDDARDRRTQIAWGMADFRYRFRREAEGMWLPETAANGPTLDALIDAGVRFTVLAPHQVARVRDRPHHDPAATHLDSGRPYRLVHSDGSGRWLAVFLYDGALARSLAFDPETAQASVLLGKLAAAGGSGLVSAALDGETFGHHHPFGELGLAYGLFAGAEDSGLVPTSYAALLAEQTPVEELELVAGEGTSWSCAHGLGRWTRDCGCATGGQPGWDQRWRAPLRAALDVVRDLAAEAFLTRGGELLKDPWAAREAYVNVRLGVTSPEEFLDRHGLRQLGDAGRVDARTLLEAQRHALLMYTSCGWFFADVAGIETVYVLRAAARVLGLLREAGIAVDDRDVLDRLGEARSNDPVKGTGADVWRREVAGAEVSAERIAAHTALVGLVRPLPAAAEDIGHAVEVHDYRSERRGRLALSTARLTVRSLATGREGHYAVGAVHLGDLDFHGVLCDDPGGEDVAALVAPLWAGLPSLTVAGLIRALDEVFGTRDFGFERVLPEGRAEVVRAVFGDLTARFREQYSRLYADNRRLLEMLGQAGFPLPRDLRAAAELTLSAQLEQDLRVAVAGSGAESAAAVEAVRRSATVARASGYTLDVGGAPARLAAAVEAAVRSALATPAGGGEEAVDRWLALADDLGVTIDIATPQELVYETALKARAGRLSFEAREGVEHLGARLGLAPSVWSPRRAE